MIIKLANGKTIVIADVVEDPKAKAIKWLRQYKESLGCDPGSGSETQSEEKGASNVTDCTTS